MCDFKLTKRNDVGKAYANIYLLSLSTNNGMQQIISNGTAIQFNGYSKLASISWQTRDELTLLKSGTFKIDFIVNYVSAITSNIQVSLFLNGESIGGSFGSNIMLVNGVKQLTGTYTLKLNKDDKLQLKGLGPTFTIKKTGTGDEIIANLTVSEI